MLSLSPNSIVSGKQSLYPDGDPHYHQNLVSSSLAHWQPSLKISCKSVRKFFLRKVANKQTNRQRRKHNLLGAGNNPNVRLHCRLTLQSHSKQPTLDSGWPITAVVDTVPLLWPPIVMDRPLYFAAVVSIFFLLSSFFLAYSQQSKIGCLPYFRT